MKKRDSKAKIDEFDPVAIAVDSRAIGIYVRQRRALGDFYARSKWKAVSHGEPERFDVCDFSNLPICFPTFLSRCVGLFH
jgi:hypothetical protein